MNFKNLILKRGTHQSREDGMCATEVVAWLNKEPHSDKPVCACPAMTAAFQKLNDRHEWESDEERTDYLKPLLPKLIGTRDTQSQLRAELLVHHALSWTVPFALDKAAEVLDKEGYSQLSDTLRTHAKELRSNPTRENALAAMSATYVIYQTVAAAAPKTTIHLVANAAYNAVLAASHAADAHNSVTAIDAALAVTGVAYATANAANAAAYSAALAATGTIYTTASAANTAADVTARRHAKREVLFEIVRVLTECLEKFPAKPEEDKLNA